MVQCQQTCGKEIRAGEYSTHKCAEEPGPSDADVQTACHVLRTLASTSSQRITITTEGTVEYNIDVYIVSYTSYFLLSHSHLSVSHMLVPLLGQQVQEP